MFNARKFFSVAGLGQDNQFFHYSTKDSIDEVLAEGYFNQANSSVKSMNFTSYNLMLRVGDWVKVNAGDAYADLVVVESTDDTVKVAFPMTRRPTRTKET